MSRLRRVDAGWALVLLLSLIAVAPLSAPGFFLKAHDATIGSYFLWQFDQGIADGVLYPRWAMDWTFGYGYPLFVVIAPLAFYVAEAIHLLGASLVGALKVVYALAFVLSGLSMYLLARELFGRAGGLLAAALYLYAPYHLVDIYVRADVAEFAAFAFFPAILWAILRLNRAATRAEMLRYLALGGLLYGGLILTHITMAMVFTPLALAYAAVSSKQQAGRGDELTAGDGTSPLRVSPSPTLPISSSPTLRVSPSPRLRATASAALFALGGAIGAVYLLPGFLEQRFLQAQNLVGGYFGYAGHYVYPFQFLSPFWGYGYAAIGASDQMPYQLGALAVVLAICSLWALPRMERGLRQQALFFLLVTGVTIFAMLSASQPLWDLLRPFVAFVQFPWRLLALTALNLALLGGALAAPQPPIVGGIPTAQADDPASRLAPPVHVPALQANGAQHVGALLAASPQAAPLLVVLALLASYAYVTPQYTDAGLSLPKMIRFQLDTKELLGDTIWVTERPDSSPMVADYLAGRPLTRVIPDDARAQVDVLHAGGASYEVQVRAAAATDVLVQIRYFPGWKVYLDGATVQPTIRPPQGLMAVAVPQGEHRLLLRFEDTPLRVVSKVIALLGLAAAGVLLLWARRGAGRGPLPTDDGTDSTDGTEPSSMLPCYPCHHP